MSWHTKENYEVSEIHPRMQAPRGHGLNGVARVQPMVPEVSVFSHTSEPRVVNHHRQPLTPTNGRRCERSVEDSLCRTIPLKKAPNPHQPPMRADFRASDIEASVAPEAKNSVNFEEQKAILNNPEDLFKVLSWQNEQLMRLQEQVRQLLACQSPSGSSVAESSFERQQSKIMVDSSTQVSTPNSPIKNSSILRNANKTDTFEASFNPESLPLGASAGKLASPPPPPAPQFEEDDDDDDDDQIQCRDVQPVDDLDELIGQFGNIHHQEVKQPEALAKEESCVEVRRLRDMGVSFISKEDLYPKKDEKKETSIWYPRAMDPGQVSSVASTSDYSLMINSAALKYLNDAQLTQVARKSPHSNVSFEPANVTRYGLPEHNISQSTRHFLSSNDLTKKNSSD